MNERSGWYRRSGLVALLWLLLGAMGLAAGQPGRVQGGRERAEIPATLPAVHGPTLRGSPVYPAQQLPLRFSHREHLRRGIDCLRCHRSVADSTRSEDANLPRGAACDGCHGDQHAVPMKQPAQCGTCHTRMNEGRVTETIHAPPAMLKFNHKLHLQQGTSCTTCHGDMSKVGLATTSSLPKEATCLTCHDGLQATARCAACHPSGSGGQLVTRARDDRVSVPLVPRGTSSWGVAHDLAFVEDHATQAKANEGLCRSCHREADCQSCHQGAVRPLRMHSGDYIATHAVDARARTGDCQSCHRAQSFCLSCHERVGVGRRDPGAFGVGSGLSFHPDGWSGPPGTAQGHAHAAQRNIGACVSCHDEQSCMACHATPWAPVPGLGVNPHGLGFAGSPRCEALANHNRRACLKCHPPDAARLECR